MKCINKKISMLLCILCTATVFITGCGTSSTIQNSYDAYSYSNSYTNNVVSVSEDYFAENLCVTQDINFGTDQTYSYVAEGAGVFNVTKQEVTYSQNLFTKLYPASTTKILTAYIILKDCDLNDTVIISESAADQASDSSSCGFRAGDQVTVNDLLYGLMLYSGNDAAEALAEHHSGSIERFAEIMTQEAIKLGATNSQFKNPSGLPDEEHYTTVYDMYLIFNKAIQSEEFIKIINTKSKTVYYTNESGENLEKTFYNHNRYHTGTAAAPEGFEVIGGKTGTTYAAGYCLVLYSQNPDGEDIISIVFKADSGHNLYLLMNEILTKFAK